MIRRVRSEPDDKRRLDMWTVYDHPRDFPNVFVARRWYIDMSGSAAKIVATDDTLEANTLHMLRVTLMQMGKTCLHRMPGDDPKIVEVWV